MSRSALLLLFLAACTAPQQRREFRDGAPVRAPAAEPRTVYTPTGAGLPEYWGQPEAKPERSPYIRVLPQTPETMREPGIWASDSEDDATAPRVAIILGVIVPFPPDATTDTEKWPTYSCATVISSQLGEPRMRPYFSEMQRKCLAARMYRRCVSSLARPGMSEADTRRFGMHTRHANALIERWCEGVPLTPEMTGVENDVAKVFAPRVVGGGS